MTVSSPGWLLDRARNGHATFTHPARFDHDVPQRCWAAWRVMPSRELISAQE